MKTVARSVSTLVILSLLSCASANQPVGMGSPKATFDTGSVANRIISSLTSQGIAVTSSGEAAIESFVAGKGDDEAARSAASTLTSALASASAFDESTAKRTVTNQTVQSVTAGLCPGLYPFC